MASIGDLSGS